MRPSTLIPAIFAAGAIALPAPIITDWFTVTDWVTVTDIVYVTAGQPGPAGPSSAPAQNHQHSWTWSHWGHSPSSTPVATSLSSVPSPSSAEPTPVSTPVASPSDPAASPSEPAASPSTPVASPSTPVASPSIPVASPSTPAASPSTPAASPSTPAASPTTPASSPSTAPASQPTGGSSNDGSPIVGGVSILATINKWHKAYDLKELAWSDSLAADALATDKANNGGDTEQLQHPGGYKDSFGEIITPGMTDALDGYDLKGDTPFDLAMASWLCEVSTDPQLQADGFTGQDQCAIVKDVLNMQYSSTGHHDILTDDRYDTVGCAFMLNPSWKEGKDPYQGLWACDFGISGQTVGKRATLAF